MKARCDQRKEGIRRGERRLGIKCETKGEAQARRRTNQVSAERLSHNRHGVISGSEEVTAARGRGRAGNVKLYGVTRPRLTTAQQIAQITRMLHAKICHPAHQQSLP